MNEDSICEFIGRSVELLGSLLPPDFCNWGLTTLDRKDSGYSAHISRKSELPTIIAVTHAQHQLPSVRELREALEADVRFQKIQHDSAEQWDGKRWYWLEPGQVVLSLLNQYLLRLDRLKYEESWADQIASNFIGSLETESSAIIYYAVVRGLECDFQYHTLPNGIHLRRLTDDEICHLLDHKTALLQDDDLPGNRCLLEHRLELPVSRQPPDVNTIVDRFDSVITALRLLRDGRVEYQDVNVRRGHPGQLAVIAGGLMKANRRFPIMHTYDLAETDLSALGQILRAIEGKTVPTRMQVAMDRINFAAERERPDDKLLDILIAMEALFGDAPGAIGYKIGMRCAAFVEPDLEGREHICEFVNEAYRRRSALVHGGRSKRKPKLTNDQIVEELLVLIRSSISRIVEGVLSGHDVPTAQDFDRLLLQ